MFTAGKVTEIFYLADEFCKFFDAEQEKSMLSAYKLLNIKHINIVKRNLSHH